MVSTEFNGATPAKIVKFSFNARFFVELGKNAIKSGFIFTWVYGGRVRQSFPDGLTPIPEKKKPCILLSL